MMNSKLMKVVTLNDTVTERHVQSAWMEFMNRMMNECETAEFTKAMKMLNNMSDSEFELMSSLAKDEHKVFVPSGWENFNSLWCVLSDIELRYIRRKLVEDEYDFIPDEDEVFYTEQPVHKKAHSKRNKRRAHNIKDTRKHGLSKYYSKLNWGRNDTCNQKYNWERYHWLDIELSSL